MRLFRSWIYVVVAGLILLCRSGFARPMTIFGGQTLSTVGITADSWGGGTAKESGDKVYSGASSIKVVTQGLFKGGHIDFANPLMLMTGPPDKAEYLQFMLSFTAVEVLSAGDEAALPYAAKAGMPAGYEEEETAVKPKVNRIRLVLVDERGGAAEVLQPISVHGTEEGGWSKVAVPMAAIQWPIQPEMFRLRRLVFTTDVPDTIYIGDIRIVTDNTPITAEAGEEQVVAARDVVVFKAKAEGGASTLTYSWDFDKSDGIQEDATGPLVTYAYTKRGEYDATLTVKDYHGLKDPATATVHVSVGD